MPALPSRPARAAEDNAEQIGELQARVSQLEGEMTWLLETMIRVSSDAFTKAEQKIIGELQALRSHRQTEMPKKAGEGDIAEMQPDPVCFCGKHGVPCPRHGPFDKNMESGEKIIKHVDGRECCLVKCRECGKWIRPEDIGKQCGGKRPD